MLRTGTTKHREDGLGAAHRTELEIMGVIRMRVSARLRRVRPLKRHTVNPNRQMRRAVTEICDREAQVNSSGTTEISVFNTLSGD